MVGFSLKRFSPPEELTIDRPKIFDYVVYTARMADQDRAKERQRLAELYASMADGELEKIADDGANLSDVARAALGAEIAKRKLGLSLPPVTPVEAESSEPAKIVTIRKYLNVADALLAKGVLESAGIDCFLADENLVRLDWFWSNAIGGVKLWVREEDAPAALSILDEKPPKISTENHDES